MAQLPTSTSPSKDDGDSASRLMKSVARMFRPRRRPCMPSLAMVMSGDTCYPVSLKNFEAYLTHKEYSVEILQFVVWFQDYRQRFLALPGHRQAASPGRSKFAFALPSPARTAQRVRASKALADSMYAGGSSLGAGARSLSSTSTNVDTRGSLTPVETSTSIAQRDYLFSRDSHPAYGLPLSVLTSPPLSQAAEVPFASSASGSVRPNEQPFRQECMRIVATFLRPDAAKELPLDPTVRDTVIRDLTWNTHPDVLLPIYEEMFQTLETISLPRFLAEASNNINRPKQLLWYSLGVIDTLLGILLAVLLVCLVPIPPESNRAWRLFSVVPAMVGMCQLYSAYRGFCSQVWWRGATQLHEWELEEMDAKTEAYWDSLLAPTSPSAAPSSIHVYDVITPERRLSYPHDTKTEERWDERTGADRPASGRTVTFRLAHLDIAWPRHGHEDKQAPAPAQANQMRPRLPPLSTSLRLQARSKVRASSMPAPAQHEFDLEKARGEQDAHARRRPPIFGPEKVVLDPRIRTLHLAVMRDLVCFGVVSTAAFAAIVLAVPGGKG
ncbi:hypothetical protein DAEQUDRAFT_764788 [Daedalea quercina L-15889]|uniref:RGS domain-containing protein n=1 Tax=Daedalea quercina L-15889 TaxID=1314783 RepID=A0A165R5P9_9APHY|nr:hypothetical protein DAEQUDRAFT_764788 [Daedalea quercina L-15889]